MLEIKVEPLEIFDESTNTFIHTKEVNLQLEHSLLSLKKWEEKWHEPFLEKNKTSEQIRDYIRCMTISPKDVDPNVYKFMPDYYMEKIDKYMNDKMTATWFNENALKGAQKNAKEVITAEIIYYWMISLNVPIEFQKWHLNQLLTLIKVLSIKNAPKDKVDKKEAAAQRKALNEARLAKLHTKG